MKNLICLLFCVCTSLILAQYNINEFYAAELKLELLFSNASYQDYNFNYNRREFFNDNLNFTNTENTINSSLKISGEIISGSILGFGCAMLMKSLINPKKDAVGLFIGYPIQFFLIAVGATHGTSLGVFSLGKILGDDGSYWYTYSWSVITACMFYVVGSAFTKDPESRLIITSVGLPIGAVIGFNTNELIELFDNNLE